MQSLKHLSQKVPSQNWHLSRRPELADEQDMHVQAKLAKGSDTARFLSVWGKICPSGVKMVWEYLGRLVAVNEAVEAVGGGISVGFAFAFEPWKRRFNVLPEISPQKEMLEQPGIRKRIILNKRCSHYKQLSCLKLHKCLDWFLCCLLGFLTEDSETGSLPNRVQKCFV